ncbi:hypothetical protein [Pseudochrobactrum lubricantis]|uniref:hypothetical protein n=1 Tax=Pseudochrobactrum lubricantis TaxID=558172 RepID=UPI0035D5A934
MTDALANPLRGEAACQIGSTDLVLVVEFGRLATLCEVAGCDTMDLLYTRLIGFHPKTVMAALRVLTTHPDGDQAARDLAHRAIAELSGADEQSFRKAITKALSGHINDGKKLRGEADPLKQLENAFDAATSGNVASPS